MSMNAIRLLAKMTAKGVQISGGAAGGTVEISRADVAAALSFAGVSVTADRLVRFLYCDDRYQGPLLQAALVQELRRRVPVGLHMLHRLVRLALVELVRQRECKACDGAGMTGAAVCPTCSGAGFRPMSQRERADLLEVPQTTFRRSHEGHANTVYQYVASMAGDALSKLAAQFADRAA